MGLLDLFRGKMMKEKATTELDPLADLVLGKLRVGYLVDYDLETWQVTAHNRYKFDEVDEVDEWELTAGREKRFLERSENDGVHWALAKKVAFGKLGSAVRSHILEHEEAPDEVVLDGTTYYLDESAAGNFYADGKSDGDPLIKWEFVDDDEKGFLTIEQWSESKLEAATSIHVEEYQFTSILPGQTG
jgi:hypothetical protein